MTGSTLGLPEDGDGEKMTKGHQETCEGGKNVHHLDYDRFNGLHIEQKLANCVLSICVVYYI